uniref:lectin-like domain-containing protein n=1 Tax=Carnobacterium maltaromaticum TaxID=2751 RepID=UPI00398AEDD6
MLERAMHYSHTLLKQAITNGDSVIDATSGIVTLTPDLPSSAGSFTMDSQIDLASSFYLTGRVNLGNKAE